MVNKINRLCLIAAFGRQGQLELGEFQLNLTDFKFDREEANAMTYNYVYNGPIS